jgi:hypothetical protein
MQWLHVLARAQCAPGSLTLSASSSDRNSNPTHPYPRAAAAAAAAVSVFVVLHCVGQARTVAEPIIATVSLMAESGLPCFSRGAPVANLRRRFHLEMSDAQVGIAVGS